MLKPCCVLALAVLGAAGCASRPPSTAITADATPAGATTVAPAVRTAIDAAINQMSPGASAQAITASPIAGLYQAIVQGQVLYLTADGRYVIQGNAYDVATRTPLGNATLERLRRDAIAKLQPARMIRFAPAHPKYTVTVFTDIDCPYCRAFHDNIAAINKLGIAVDYLFWPRTGLGTPSAQKAVNVWCAADRKTALSAALDGQPVRFAKCDSPVAHDFKLGVDLGVEGTPTVFADNGALLGGYVDPAELLHRLQAVHAHPGARTTLVQ